MAYNSSHTGAQIDSAVGTVREKESTWDSKQDGLRGKKGQLVGFTADNVPGAVDASSGGGGSYITLTFASDFVGQAWTLSGGGETYTGTVDSSLTATVSVLGINTTYTLSAALSGTTYTAEVTTKDYFTALNIELSYANVFGVCWDTSNSSTALMRLTPETDPYGLVTKSVTTEPKPAVGTGSGSSPFDSYAPWSGIKECNLNNAGVVTAWKGDSGFSRSNNFTMVFIPEFYVAAKRDGTKQYFYVSDKPKTGMTKHPGSGKYVGRYTIPGSKSGVTSTVNITRTTARSNAKKNGDKWHLYDFATYCAIIFLYVVEFADWNPQNKIAYGRAKNQSSAVTSGKTDTMVYHTGTGGSKISDGAAACQYRWLENLWGNLAQWVDGINISRRVAFCCTDPSKYEDDTADGYTNIGELPNSDGFITDLTVTNNGLLIPKAVGGSDTTYIPDYVSGNLRDLCALYVGGCWYDNSRAGLLYFNANFVALGSDTNVSARLICEP